MEIDRKLCRDDCLLLLCEKRDALLAQGEARYPRRADFSEREVVAIKAFLGPWPRALEAAGIKPPRDGDRRERLLQKRIQAKRRRTEAKKKAPTAPSCEDQTPDREAGRKEKRDPA